MTESTPHSPLLLSGSAHERFAQQLAVALNFPLLDVNRKRFADGETFAHLRGDVHRAHVFVVQPLCPPVNDHVWELALLVDAAVAAGAARVTGIVPCMLYFA